MATRKRKQQIRVRNKNHPGLNIALFDTEEEANDYIHGRPTLPLYIWNGRASERLVQKAPTYKSMAQLVASKLTTAELKSLAVLLDGDARNDFCFHIQEETAKVAPELFGPVKLPPKKHAICPYAQDDVNHRACSKCVGHPGECG